MRSNEGPGGDVAHDDSASNNPEPRRIVQNRPPLRLVSCQERDERQSIWRVCERDLRVAEEKMPGGLKNQCAEHTEAWRGEPAKRFRKFFPLLQGDSRPDDRSKDKPGPNPIYNQAKGTCREHQHEVENAGAATVSTQEAEVR